MRSTILAALAAVPLFLAALPAEAGDWRRHHHRDRGVVVLPGITLQLGPRYVAPRYVAPRYVAPPRYGHDRRAYSYGPDRYRGYGWHGGHRFDRHHRYRGRHEQARRGGHRRRHH